MFLARSHFQRLLELTLIVSLASVVLLEIDSVAVFREMQQQRKFIFLEYRECTGWWQSHLNLPSFLCSVLFLLFFISFFLSSILHFCLSFIVPSLIR
jgi:hypothetical protein